MQTATTRHRSLHHASGGIRLILVLPGRAERSRVQGMHPWNASVASLPVPVPLVPPLVRTLVPLTRAHASSCICMFDSSPLLGSAAPRLRRLLSFSRSLSLHLFLYFSTGLFPLSAARLVELFFVCRASPLYRCYTRRRPLVESRPAKESLRSLRITIARARTARHSSLIAPNVHGIPNCVRPTRVKSHNLHALTLVIWGANRTRLLLKSRYRAEAEGQWPDRCSQIQ